MQVFTVEVLGQALEQVRSIREEAESDRVEKERSLVNTRRMVTEQVPWVLLIKYWSYGRATTANNRDPLCTIMLCF